MAISIFLCSRFQSWRIIPIVMRSARGNSSLRKSISSAATRPVEAGLGDAALGDRPDDRQVAGAAGKVRMAPGDDRRELPGRAADVGERPVGREVERVGEGLEIGARDAGHRAP